MALTDVPQTFQPDDEVRIAHYFRELGFEADETSLEDKFFMQLGHTSLELVIPSEAYLILIHPSQEFLLV